MTNKVRDGKEPLLLKTDNSPLTPGKLSSSQSEVPQRLRTHDFGYLTDGLKVSG